MVCGVRFFGSGRFFHACKSDIRKQGVRHKGKQAQKNNKIPRFFSHSIDFIFSLHYNG